MGKGRISRANRRERVGEMQSLLVLQGCLDCHDVEEGSDINVCGRIQDN